MNRCSGECCRSFYLRQSITELKRAYEQYMEGEREVGLEDIAIIYPMLISRAEDGDDSSREHKYDCKHLQPNGDCGIYEKRPGMCRAYPNNKPCPHANCQWPLGQLGMWPGLTPLKRLGELEL